MLAFALSGWRLAAVLAAPLPLQVDEAQYAGWSHALAPGYYSKPPMIAFAIAGAGALCPWRVERRDAVLDEGCVRMLQPVAMLVAGLSVAATAAALGLSAGAAAAALALFVSAPFAAFYSLFATTDAWLLMWWSLALLALVRALRDAPASRWPWIACGACVGFGLLAKYSMGVFVVAAAILAWRRGLLRSPGPWLAAGVALAVFLPNLWWNAQHGFATIGHHADISGVAQAGEHGLAQRVGSVASFVAAQFGVFSPVVFAVFVLACWRALRHGVRTVPPGVRIGLLFAGAMLLLIMAQALSSRAFANWALPAAIGVSIVAAWWLVDADAVRVPTPRRLLLGLTLAFNLVLGALVIHGPAVFAATRWADDAARNPFLRLQGWREAALEVRDQVAAAPGLRVVAEDRRLLAAISAYGWPDVTDLRAWDPGAADDDHYRRFQDLAQAPAAATTPILLVLEGPRVPGGAQAAPEPRRLERLEAAFPGLQRVPDEVAPRVALVAPGGRRDRRIVLYRADGFAPPAARLSAASDAARATPAR